MLDYRRVHNISIYMAGVREIYSPIGMKWIQPPSQHLGLHRFMGPLSSLRLRRFLWDRWCPWFLGTWRHLPKKGASVALRKPFVAPPYLADRLFRSFTGWRQENYGATPQMVKIWIGDHHWWCWIPIGPIGPRVFLHRSHLRQSQVD